MSSRIVEEARELVNEIDLPDRHSYFQMEKFIVGKEVTAQAKMWQIIREMQVRTETVKGLESELADAEDNIELLDIKAQKNSIVLRETANSVGTLGREFNDLNLKELEVDTRRLVRQKEGLVFAAQNVNKKLKCVKEELAFLLIEYKKLVAEHGPCKPYDDPQAQEEMWNEKLMEEFNLRMLLKRPIDPEFIKTALCLSNTSPVRMQTERLINHLQKTITSQPKEVTPPSVKVVPHIQGK